MGSKRGRGGESLSCLFAREPAARRRGDGVRRARVLWLFADSVDIPSSSRRHVSVFFYGLFPGSRITQETTQENVWKSRKTKGREGIARGKGGGSQHRQCGKIVVAYLHIEKSSLVMCKVIIEPASSPASADNIIPPTRRARARAPLRCRRRPHLWGALGKKNKIFNPNPNTLHPLLNAQRAGMLPKFPRSRMPASLEDIKNASSSACDAFSLGSQWVR